MAHLCEPLGVAKQRVLWLEQRGAPAKKKIPTGTLNLGGNESNALPLLHEALQGGGDSARAPA
jgi:hypothetical protein